MSKNKVKEMMPAIMMIVALTILMPAFSQGADRMPQFVELKSAGDYFQCRIPADWTIYEPVFGLSAEEKKIYGVTILGPQNGSLGAPLISVHYYAPGNLLHKSGEVFIKTHSGPVLGFVTEGKSYGKVQDTELAGRKAKTFERIDIRYIGERALHPQKVSMFEKFIVIPDEKDEGFYGLKLSLPAAAKDKYAGIFDEIVKSFLPKK